MPQARTSDCGHDVSNPFDREQTHRKAAAVSIWVRQILILNPCFLHHNGNATTASVCSRQPADIAHRRELHRAGAANDRLCRSFVPDLRVWDSRSVATQCAVGDVMSVGTSFDLHNCVRMPLAAKQHVAAERFGKAPVLTSSRDHTQTATRVSLQNKHDADVLRGLFQRNCR